MGEPEISRIAGRFTRHFAELFVEMVLLLRLKPGKGSNRIRFSNPEIIDQSFRQKKNIIIMTGHYGNWEWNVLPILAAGYRVLGVYKPQTSKLADQLMKFMRHKPGIVLVTMKDTLRVVKKELQEKDSPFALILVADQIPARGDIHFWTRFLGQDSAFFTGGEKLARKLGLPIFYVDQEKHRFARYQPK
jgi:Kdo2-lipid IVA lauroyltransferase/acyltransferase